MVGFCELSGMFNNILAYVCFENAFGGGGAANHNHATAHKIPIVSYDNWKSDVSNHVEPSTRVSIFSGSLRFIERLSNDDKFYEDVINKQVAYYRMRYDLMHKGRELLSILNDISGNFYGKIYTQ